MRQAQFSLYQQSEFLGIFYTYSQGRGNIPVNFRAATPINAPPRVGALQEVRPILRAVFCTPNLRQVTKICAPPGGVTGAVLAKASFNRHFKIFAP